MAEPDVPPQDYPGPDPDDTKKKPASAAGGGLDELWKLQQSNLDRATARKEELLQKGQDIADQTVLDLEKLDRDYQRAAARGISMPHDPRFKPIPEAPQPQYRDPFNAFGNPLVIMATLGGLFTRTPAIAALNAGAAAMNAYHEGDQEKINLTRQNFEDKLKVVQAQNQQQVDLFNAEMQKTHVSMQEKLANMSAIAHAFQNKEVIAAIQNGQVDQAFKVIDGQITAQNQLNQEIMRYKEFQQREQETELYHREQIDVRRGQLAEATRAHDQQMEARMAGVQAKIGQRGLTANEFNREAAHIDMYTEAATGLDRALDLLHDHIGEAGLAGRATRMAESVSNLLGSNATDRREFESVINQLQMMAPQLLMDRTGRPLSSEAAHVATIVRGLNAGDTTANTIRRLTELREQLIRMQDRAISRIEGKWNPEAARYGSGETTTGAPTAPRPPISAPSYQDDPIVGQ